MGDHAYDAALWTEREGRAVVTASHAIDLDALRETPMWSGVEAVVGRRLCSQGDKGACRRAGDRGDLCATRAMPVAQPSSDLRHLVATGPEVFDFFPEAPPNPPGASQRLCRGAPKGPRRSRARGRHVEYLHSCAAPACTGRLAPAADRRLRRVVSSRRRPERTAWPRPGFRSGVARTPRTTARRPRSPAIRCATVVRGWCAPAPRALAGAAPVRSVGAIYGAKTGTIDSLGDVAARREACLAFRDAHTLADRPRKLSDQPYWLDCESKAQPPDDSLVLVAFGVPTPQGGVTTLTLGLRFQRSGGGFAALAARHYIDLVRDYFAPAARRLP